MKTAPEEGGRAKKAPVDADLGRVVIYHAADGDDTPELVAYPLCAGMEAFAAIIARVHRGGRADLMVLDPSRGPMPRWKVPFSEAPEPGTWSHRREDVSS